MNSKYINRKALQAVALFFGLAFTACSTEDEFTPPTSTKSHTVTITATQPSQDAASRMAFNTEGDGYWQKGDQITVVSENGSDQSFSTFSMTEGAGTNSATFTGSTKFTRLAYAFYPANDQHQTGVNNNLVYYLPATYTYTQVNTDYVVDNGVSFNMPMMAAFGDDDNTTATFKYIGGMLAVKIDRLPATKGTVTVTTKSNICGQNYLDNEDNLSSTFTDGSKTVTFNYSGATAWASGVFYLPLPAGTYYELAVTVSSTSTNAGTLTYTAKANKSIEIVRGHIKKLKVTTDYSITINDHKFVDLGLPTGTLWGDCNINADNCTQTGYYYAWGETFTRTSYDGSNYSFDKYNSLDGKTTLELEDDAANSYWCPPCRIPSDTEWGYLINNCTVTYTTQDGVNGYTITSKTNGNSIFLPLTGYYDSTILGNTNKGYYWTNTRCDVYQNAWAMVFDPKASTTACGTLGRPYGCVIRAVVQP